MIRHRCSPIGVGVEWVSILVFVFAEEILGVDLLFVGVGINPKPFQRIVRSCSVNMWSDKLVMSLVLSDVACVSMMCANLRLWFGICRFSQLLCGNSVFNDGISYFLFINGFVEFSISKKSSG